jgi:3-oxoacyl-[acyl-carrier-protein] synthase-3
MMMTAMTIIGTGVALPGAPIPSAALATRFGLNAEWADHFIGTKTRHLAVNLETGEQFETLASLGSKAALVALERAGLQASDLDFVVLATATPDELMPTTVNRIALDLGATHIPAYQVQSGCAGAIQAFDLGGLLLGREELSTGLLIGGDVCVRHLEITPEVDAAHATELVNYLLFGDGVGAAVVTNQRSPGMAVLDVANEMTAIGGSAGQVIRWYGQRDLGANDREPALMEDYKAIERLVPVLAGQVLDELLQRQGWSRDDVDYLLPPQLAGRITTAIAEGLQPAEATTVVNCVAATGNCGNGLPFIQLDLIFDDVQPGQTLACVGVESSMWIKGGLALRVVA